MPKINAPAGSTAANPPADEPRNVAISAKENRTKIGKAIVAAGPVDFPVTKTVAEQLRDLGLVEITGVFTA